MVAGAAGLLMGLLLFPESNLLGGLALVFGPLLMLGGVITMACLVAATIRWLLR